MGVLQSSGYLTTPITISWSAGQSLDSLADNEFTDLSDEIDNTSNLYKVSDFEVVLGSAAFTGADSGLELYIVRSVDGTNYPTWTGNGTSDEQENVKYLRDSSLTTGTTASQRMVFFDIVLPPGKFKVAFRNRANVTLAGSGNTVKHRPHSVQMSA